MKCLAYTRKGTSIYFERQRLCLPDGDSIRMPVASRIKSWLGRWRCFERLFRLEPRCAAFLSPDKLLVAYQRKLWIVDIDNAEIVKTISVRQGFSDILSFCQMAHGEVYYGDYGMNPGEEPIHIYKIGVDLVPTIVYTFPAHQIRHIHSLIYDKWRNLFFIFTGDMGEHVGIYVANRDFSNVKPFLVGSQQFRAVVGHVTERYLYYATDAVMEDNYLYRVVLDGNPLEKEDNSNVECLEGLNGSVIYGCQLSDGFLMSTTVEPYPSKKSRVMSLLDNRKGLGIKSADVLVYKVSDEGKLHLLERYKKDGWPMRLLQYGCVQFPALEDESVKEVPVNPVAVKECDGKPQTLIWQ